MAEANIKIENLDRRFEEFDKKYDQGHQELVTMIKEISEKKADKWVEWSIKSVAAIMLAGVLAAVFKSIFK